MLLNHLGKSKFATNDQSICTEQWRADVGQFHLLLQPIRRIKSSLGSSLNIQNIFMFFFNLFCCLFLQQHRDIDVKNRATVEHFSCCHCNVNGLATHDCKKALLLEAYNVIHHYKLILVSETYLDISISNDKKDTSIIRADNTSNTKQRRVCIHYKESLSVHLIDIPNLRVYSLSSYNK